MENLEARVNLKEIAVSARAGLAGWVVRKHSINPPDAVSVQSARNKVGAKVFPPFCPSRSVAMAHYHATRGGAFPPPSPPASVRPGRKGEHMNIRCPTCYRTMPVKRTYFKDGFVLRACERCGWEQGCFLREATGEIQKFSRKSLDAPGRDT